MIVIVGNLLATLAFKSKKFEQTFQGVNATLVNDGVLDIEQLKSTYITKGQLFAVLREQQIKHLGEVKRVYLEANGEFSLVRERINPSDCPYCQNGIIKLNRSRTGIMKKSAQTVVQKSAQENVIAAAQNL